MPSQPAVADELSVMGLDDPQIFGTRFARIQDASANIRWIWQHGELVWGEPSGAKNWTTEEQGDAWGEVSPEFAYIHDTLLGAMTALRDPKA